MDPNQIDRLARLVGSGQSRRGVLKTLAGGALGAITAAVGRDQANAAARCRGMGVVCSKNADCCSSACLPKDRTGRRVCGCGAPSECPGSSDQCQLATCTAGACGLTPIVCNDNNSCTTDSCHPKLGCVYTPKNCDDGNACTTDSCDAQTGNCVHTPIVCNDGNACTTDTCDQVKGCTYTVVSCDDGNPCTTDTCDAQIGCVHTAANDGAPCGAGGVCDGGSCCTPNSQETTCAGKCGTQTNNCGQQIDCGTCGSGGVCVSGSCCTPACTSVCGGEDDGCGGVCPTAANGTPCNDGNSSTCNDVCTNGTCGGSACLVGDVCSSNACTCHAGDTLSPVTLCNAAAPCALFGESNCACDTDTDGATGCWDYCVSCESAVRCTSTADCSAHGADAVCVSTVTCDGNICVRPCGGGGIVGGASITSASLSNPLSPS